MKTHLIAVFIFILLAGGAYAYDWAGKGLSVSSEVKEGEATVLTLKDAEGRSFTVNAVAEIDEAAGNKIIELKNAFYAWSVIKIRTISFEKKADALNIAILPAELTYKGLNILEFMPAGISLSLTDVLVYNFRITRNNIFIRVYGEYSDEQELCEKIYEGASNPAGYIRKREPEYFLSRINELKTANERLTAAVLALHNTGFLGFGAGPIDKKAIARVIELKRQSPGMTRRELEQALEKEKIKISGKELDLVLSVFFNEFN